MLCRKMRNLPIILGAKRFLRLMRRAALSTKTCWARIVTTRLNLLRNKGKKDRCLEIGPGSVRIVGFETLNIIWNKGVDYILNASARLPFDENTFEIVHASHVLEHIPWYQVEDTLKEWIRIIKPGGHLEVCVPDGLKICKILVDYELYGKDNTQKDGWYRYNPDKDPYKWVSGRLFTYGDGTGNPKSPNWHRSLFTERCLRLLFEKVGLTDIRRLKHEEVRGYDHGWINLGMIGTKP
jgi:SAM-dependent methyltransferase